MRRREFIAGLGGAAVAWPLAARAQQAERVRRIGLLVPFDGVLFGAVTGADLGPFREELAKLGWVEGRNLWIDLRSGRGDVDRIRSYAAELVSLDPDVFVTSSAVATNAVQQQTQTIPIVFFGAGGISESGDTVVRSVARPEGNTTGITNLYFSVGGKWLQLLKDAAPWLTRAAVIFNPDFNRQILRGGGYAAPIAAAAPLLGVQVIWTPYRSAVELEQAIARFAAEPNGGLILLPANDPVVETTYRLAAQYSLPAIYPNTNFVRAGGLMSYGPNGLGMMRQLASYVDRILRGTKPGDLPVQFPAKFDLAINRKAAMAIGLELPAALLGTADEVIE
jgi:putative ABC transport system substrate-binding protein